MPHRLLLLIVAPVALSLGSIYPQVALAKDTSSAVEAKNSPTEADRDPASALQIKKEMATEGLPQPEEPKSRLLNANWRNSLEEKGVEWDGFLYWDRIENKEGGEKIGAFSFTTLDLMSTIDLNKIAQWDGYSVFLHYHMNEAADPFAYFSDVNGVSAFSWPNRDSLLSQAYIKKESAEDHWSFLFGLYDFSTEFFFSDSAVIFLNNSFTAPLTLIPPSPYEWLSWYPVNGPGLRFRKVWDEKYYLMMGASTAQARDPNLKTGTHPLWNDKTGTYQNIEVGYHPEAEDAPSNKFLFGFWWVNKTISSLEDPAKQKTPYGYYFMADYILNNDLSLFFNIGGANKETNLSHFTSALGFNYRRVATDSDLLGLGYSITSPNENSTAGVDEKVIELLYRNEVYPGFTIVPDFQWIQNPSFEASSNQNMAFTIHLEMAL